MGDALLFADRNDPLKGFLFDGRLAEDFKMASGTWVSVGPLRTRFLTHFLSLAQDVVITAPDRDFVGGLIFPDLAACRKIAGGDTTATADQILASPGVRAAFQELLNSFATLATGSSTRVDRILILTEPPRLDRQEITDKGSINQKRVLHNRADLVEELYKHQSSGVISVQTQAVQKGSHSIEY